MNLVLLATAWGAKHGGINAFNRDFALALAQEVGGSGKIFCAVIDPSADDVEDAATGAVIIIPLLGKSSFDRFDSSWAHEICDVLKSNHNNPSIDCWIGHDLSTGQAAIEGARLGASASALIMHMSYIDYQGMKHDSSRTAEEKHRLQVQIFTKASHLFAVGPLLRSACEGISGRRVVQLIPGFPNIEPQRSRDDQVVAIAFGRLDKESDRIKQGRLAAAAFGAAVKEATDLPAGPEALQNGRISLLGISEAHETEEDEINALAEKYANRVVNVLALSFDEDRARLFSRLRESNLAMMLSLREGFGLTGWEAIACEIPLILSKWSGLWQLIDRELGGAGLGCVRVVDIKGRRGSDDNENFSDDDLLQVRTEILRIAANISRAKADARSLKELLVSKLECTWQVTAKTFLNALSVEPDHNRGSQGSDASGGPAPLVAVQTASSLFQSQSSDSVPDCATLSLTTTQGSTPASFDLLAELFFGQDEFVVDEVTVAVGLEEAFLRLQLSNCKVPVGSSRLGEDINESNVAAGPNNTWTIRGPKENKWLQRRALGEQPLCCVVADENANAEVVIELLSRLRHVDCKVVAGDKRTSSTNKERILGVFLGKCMGIKDGTVQLSRASLSTKRASA